jgi:hypothetical protein
MNDILRQEGIIEGEGEVVKVACRYCGGDSIIDYGIAKKCSDCRKMQ